MAQPGQWQVGQLYKNGLVNGLPVFTQPGGIGTTVYPQAPALFPQQYMGYPQVVMNYPSLYVALCGHSFNCYEIFEVIDPYAGVQVALCCCPVCSLIQEIISPYENYSNYQDAPLIVS